MKIKYLDEPTIASLRDRGKSEMKRYLYDVRIRDRHGGSELRKLHETLSITSYPILCVYIYHEATIRILFACTGKWFAIKQASVCRSSKS